MLDVPPQKQGNANGAQCGCSNQCCSLTVDQPNLFFVDIAFNVPQAKTLPNALYSTVGPKLARYAHAAVT